MSSQTKEQPVSETMEPADLDVQKLMEAIVMLGRVTGPDRQGLIDKAHCKLYLADVASKYLENDGTFMYASIYADAAKKQGIKDRVLGEQVLKRMLDMVRAIDKFFFLVLL